MWLVATECRPGVGKAWGFNGIWGDLRGSFLHKVRKVHFLLGIRSCWLARTGRVFGNAFVLEKLGCLRSLGCWVALGPSASPPLQYSLFPLSLRFFYFFLFSSFYCFFFFLFSSFRSISFLFLFLFPLSLILLRGCRLRYNPSRKGVNQTAIAANPIQSWIGEGVQSDNHVTLASGWTAIVW